MAVTLNLNEDLAALLHGLNRPVQESALELMTLELYRRGTISSGKAAQMLGMDRWEFVHHASRLGIALFDMTNEEWQSERLQADSL